MRILADEQQLKHFTGRMADQLKSLTGHSDGPWAIVGVQRRGDLLAERLAQEIQPAYQGSVDITLYRDDLSEIGPQPVVRTTKIDFPVDGTNIILVDDVLMTGRSVRAALQSILDFGRPRCVKLVALVDRGGRELPITADVVGLRVHAEASDRVDVRMKPMDEEDAIVMQSPGESSSEMEATSVQQVKEQQAAETEKPIGGNEPGCY